MVDECIAAKEGQNNAENATIDLSAISDKEKEACREFFIGKANKTPERYLRIRNHIIQLWNQCKPKYLTKIAVRPGLKDCGDVNAIGRVHTYLEKANPRKRRVRDEYGEWINEDELEGRVISHEVIVRTDKDGSSTKRRKSRAGSYSDDEWGDFTLIPCATYTELFPEPFKVFIDSEVMFLVDLHSHMASTEIIGLLGGKYDDKNKTLHILSAFPCKSTSTTIQCEMDPSSEIEAREGFYKLGYQAVGWYHSHPTFAPNPSVRDIHNQTSYQDLCKLGNGTEPFVGIILTPFDTDTNTHVSRYRVLNAVFIRTDLGKPFGTKEPITKLSKLLLSLQSYLVLVPEKEAEELLDRIKDLLIKTFGINADDTTTVTDDSQRQAVSSTMI
ncbi:hypothetical protein H4219_001278 [Mycoemilia scoparia]|uniref:Myb-like, SWIRM and MPN domain-containing protein 1 n=1 Tax=Mycoemilia scoparia TaxID=417184 RepID=A0A9W8A1B7_9FUNG|nr:hypothetical protein H4219_001278 [Mycoemilia scoparia]